MESYTDVVRDDRMALEQRIDDGGDDDDDDVVGQR